MQAPCLLSERERTSGASSMSVEVERERASGASSMSVEGERERASGASSMSVEGKRASGGTSASVEGGRESLRWDLWVTHSVGSPGSHCAFEIDTLSLSPHYSVSPHR